MPATPASRSDSGFASMTLREKKSGRFDQRSRRSSSFGMDKHAPLQRPSMPLPQRPRAEPVHLGHLHRLAVVVRGLRAMTYAPSSAAASTVDAQHGRAAGGEHGNDHAVGVEGHCFVWTPGEAAAACSVCEDRADTDGLYRCRGSSAWPTSRSLGAVCLVCPVAFHTERVRAAFVRCLASLLFTYRKHLGRPSKAQRDKGQLTALEHGWIPSGACPWISRNTSL